MVLIFSNRPKNRPPHKIQPTNVFADKNTSGTSPDQASVSIAASDRNLVWEDDFSPGWETRLDWVFREEDLTAVDHPNFNGFGGVDVTYPAGSDANVRWGGNIRFPNTPIGYDEGWFTYDVLFHNTYSVSVNQKQLGIFGTHNGFGFPSSPPPGCADGWLCRLQIGDGTTSTDDLRDPKSAHMYYYWNQATRVNNHWGGSNTVRPIPMDVVCRIELYWKSNSAFNLSDGVLRHKFDPGTATTHAVPTTIRAEVTNFQTYCGSEDNRVNGNANEIGVTTFHGGPVNPAWEPTVDSKFTLGRMAIEVPA